MPKGLMLLATPPWRRALLLLLRRPSIAVAVAAAALILGVASAATPLFLSSAGSAALHKQVDRTCAYDVGPGLSALPPQAIGDFVVQNGPSVSAALAKVPHTGATELTMVMRDRLIGLPVSGPSGARTAALLVARSDFRRHIDVVSDAGGTGVWLSDEAAAAARVRAGDTVTTTVGTQTAQVRVVGTYRDLRNRPPSAYWCSLSDLLQPRDPWSNAPLLPLALTDRATYWALAYRLELSSVVSWDRPLRTEGLTTAQAHDTAAAEGGLASAVVPELNTTGQLPAMVQRADLVESSLRATVGPVTAAGTLVALLVVAAAGSYWVDRRRREVDLLLSRGVAPAMLAVKAALEMAPAAAVGGLLGWVLARVVVTSLGPSPLLSAGVATTALLWTAGAVALAVVLLGVVAALRCRARAGHPRSDALRAMGRVPWELAALGVAGLLMWRFVRGGVEEGIAGVGVGFVARVDPRVLGLPLLFLAAAVVFLARLMSPLLRRLATSGRGWAPPVYLAARRLAGAPVVALVMLAAAAMPVAVCTYAAGLTRSVQATLDAKVRLFTGSDVVASTPTPVPVPAALRGSATTVDALTDQTLDSASADVLGVDPATFADAAFWDRSFAREPLSALLARLGPAQGGRLPVIASGPGVSLGDHELEVSVPQRDRARVAVRVVGIARHLPKDRGQVVVLVSRDALRSVTAAGFPQLWVRGNEQHAIDTIREADVPVRAVLQASNVLDAASFLPVTYTFGFLTALAVLTGAIGLAGLLLYVESRTRTRRVAYVLARQMGLTRRAHFGSLLAEIGFVLGLGTVAGLVLAGVTAAAVHGRLDVAPDLPPGPLLRTPVPVMVAVAAYVAVVVIGVSIYAQRSADRSRTAEVLRDI